MPRSKSSISLLLTLLCLLLHTRPAQPKSSKGFQHHYDRAIELYQSERYSSAIEEFKAAYAVKQLPRVLFNIGQAHLKLGEAKEALSYYERYLQLEPKPPPEIQSKLEANMAQARAMLSALPKEAETTEPPPPSEPPPPEPPTVVPPAEPPVQQAGPAAAAPLQPVMAPPAVPQPRTERAPRPRWRIITGAVGLGVGVILTGFGASALAVNGRCIDAPSPGKSCSFDFDTLGVGLGLLVPGVLLSTAGVVLLALPGPRRPGK